MHEPEINRILYELWDPLGVCGAAPDDEYLEYANIISEMISKSAPDAEIIHFLKSIRLEQLAVEQNEMLDLSVVNAIRRIHK